MITAYGTIERAVEAMKEGAYDFIPKPFEPDHVAPHRAESVGARKAQTRVEVLSGQMESATA